MEPPWMTRTIGDVKEEFGRNDVCNELEAVASFIFGPHYSSFFPVVSISNFYGNGRECGTNRQ